MKKAMKKIWVLAGIMMYAAVALLVADNRLSLLDQDIYYVVVNVSYGCGFVLGWAPAAVIISSLVKKIKERRCGRYVAKKVMYLL